MYIYIHVILYYDIYIYILFIGQHVLTFFIPCAFSPRCSWWRMKRNNA